MIEMKREDLPDGRVRVTVQGHAQVDYVATHQTGGRSRSSNEVPDGVTWEMTFIPAVAPPQFTVPVAWFAIFKDGCHPAYLPENVRTQLAAEFGEGIRIELRDGLYHVDADKGKDGLPQQVADRLRILLKAAGIEVG